MLTTVARRLTPLVKEKEKLFWNMTSFIFVFADSFGSLVEAIFDSS